MIRTLGRLLVVAALAFTLPLTAPSVFGAGIHTDELQVGKGNKGTVIKGIWCGTGTLSAGVLVVNASSVAPNVKATSLIFVDRQTVAGTSGGTFAITRTNGTSFTITSQTAGALTTQTLDTSVVAWTMINL